MKLTGELLFIGAGVAVLALSAGASAQAFKVPARAVLEIEQSADDGSVYDYRGGDYPRGIRNNNPGNIEAGRDSWAGAAGDDGRYLIFSDIRYGVRAMARILASYNKRGIDTVAEIISTWAPGDDGNDVNSYIYSVSARSGLTPLAEIEKSDYPALIEAMIYHENGKQPLTMDTIKTGVSWA
ncbi:MAG: structural protein [Gammaproteobacteria bacterium]|nr:structural protein [Gammaproteobacteria bacterium]MBQ0838824.1 structural protein [Gammaproteobacteria bacterium]